jgi:hypothetical protein
MGQEKPRHKNVVTYYLEDYFRFITLSIPDRQDSLNLTLLMYLDEAIAQT